MPLAALHTLVGIGAAAMRRLFDRLDRLRIHDRRARVGIFSHPPTFSVPQPPPEVDPQARTTKLSEVIIHRLPGREIARQVAPGTGAVDDESFLVNWLKPEPGVRGNRSTGAVKREHEDTWSS